MNRTHLYVVVSLLIAIALGLFAYKVVWLGFPVVPEQQSEIWRVEVQVRLKAEGGPLKATLQLPDSTGNKIIIDQNFVSPGYGVTMQAASGGQQAVFAVREGRGESTLYYRAVIGEGHAGIDTSREAQPEVVPPVYTGAELAAAQAIIRGMTARSVDAQSFAALLVKRLQIGRVDDEANLLLGRDPQNSRLVTVAVDLLLLAGIPARVVNGIVLEPERRHVGVVRWLEVFEHGFWHTIHPVPPAAQTLRYYLPWWRGRGPMVRIDGGAVIETAIVTSRSYELSMQAVLKKQETIEKQLVNLSLFGLPLQAQALYRTIMVIPVGILLLVLLRNVIGVKTFGTFMPVLIAIAFRETGVFWGVIFFSIVVALGLAARFYLERLKLLLVPRLAAVVIIVILILAGLSVLSYRLGFDRGLSVGLFPIVILTMTIERMTVVWEERGAGEALQQALGSVVVGLLCYFVMRFTYVEHLTFVFPELLLVVLGVMLLLGRYSGYRLVELWRFKILAK